MSQKYSSLKHKINQTLIWLVIFPFLAIWPFLSAFPIFSLMQSDKLDISTSLNVIFFISGFWPLLAISVAAFALMYDDARKTAYRAVLGKGPWVGAYAILWTGLYLIASLASR